jgi:arginine:pyruvate transaminase
MRYAPLVARIAGSGADVWKTHFRAAKLRHEEGREIIDLTVGSPDQPPAAAILDEAAAAMRRYSGYAAILGGFPVRRAVAARMAKRTGMPCEMANVAIVAGAQAGLYFALQCLAGPGDEVIVLEPMYATYEAVCGATGATMVQVPLLPERGFHPDIDAIARAITPRTRVLWINSPSNPTGAVFEREEVAAIAALCQKHDLWLLSDEVYEELAYARPHTSAWSQPDMQGRTVVVSSLSKSHVVPGFRLGWIVGPPPLVEHLFYLLLCAQYGGAPFLQAGALVALTQDLPEVAAVRDTYRRRSVEFADLLARAPSCRPLRPEGGLFVMLDVRGTGISAPVFADQLLERENVAVLACDGFGPGGVGHLRISLTVDDAQLAEGGARIVRFAESLRSA